ncbi:uncharacterized protein [Pocillopora verrucosa]|uniref:uncharacterized protein isoform X3 n=1 Tax=Pocillopora verrucosa TaxID=203993 RepID=UPI00333F07C8
MESFPAWEKKANQGTTEVQIESFPGKKKAKQGPSPAHPPSDSGKTRNRVKYKLNPSLGKKKAKQGPSPAHPPSDSGKPRNRVKYKLNPSLGKKRPSKDQVLHIHLVTQGNQGPTEVQIESFPGKKKVTCGSQRVINSCHIASPAVAAGNMQGQERCWCDVAIKCIHQG